MSRLPAGVAPLFGLVLLLTAQTPTSAQLPRSTELTDAERTKLGQLAEEALKAKKLWRGKVYLTRMEVFEDRQKGNGSGKTSRKALVIHYRYDGHTALVSRIDVDRQEVIDVEEQENFPTSLAPEEIQRAGELAKANSEVKKALAKYGGPAKFEVDVVQAFTVNPEAFGYKHRLVRVFFREGRNYALYAPNVDVDLTNEQVRAVRNDKMHDK